MEWHLCKLITLFAVESWNIYQHYAIAHSLHSLNVGNYSPPSDGSWLPPDFPKCDTPFLESQRKARPSCTCDSSYKCSKSYTCSKNHNDESMPSSVEGSSSTITLVVLCIVVAMIMSIGLIYTIRTMIKRKKANKIMKQDEETLCEEYDNEDIEKNENDTSQRYSTPKRHKSSPYKELQEFVVFINLM